MVDIAMKIYLNDNLLTQSEVFEKPYLEANKPERNNSSSERDWWIYTWNSKNKLSAEEDGTSGLNRDTIEVSMRKYTHYKNCEFQLRNIPFPDYLIQISGYSSFIDTPKKDVMKLVKKLEGEDIDCLLSNGGAPIVENSKYISPRLNRKLR